MGGGRRQIKIKLHLFRDSFPIYRRRFVVAGRPALPPFAYLRMERAGCGADARNYTAGLKRHVGLSQKDRSRDTSIGATPPSPFAILPPLPLPIVAPLCNVYRNAAVSPSPNWRFPKLTCQQRAARMNFLGDACSSIPGL